MNTDEVTNNPSNDGKILLRLYVVGMNSTTKKAFHNLEKICETHFPGKYHIEVIDLKANPGLAADEQIFAVPTVERKLPLPIRKVIGDLSDSEKVLVGLDLEELT